MPSGDDFLGHLSVDEFMEFRVRPACAPSSSAAPRGRPLSCSSARTEIIVFILNASGAFLVGLEASEWVPVTVAWVPVTVALAEVLYSFMNFINLTKQVEAYNTALRKVHNVTSPRRTASLRASSPPRRAATRATPTRKSPLRAKRKGCC